MRLITHPRSANPQRLPLVVRTIGDVEILRHSPAGLRRLPRGIRVSIADMRDELAREFEGRLRAYVRACGCAEGGIAGIAGMAIVVTWGVVSIVRRGPRLTDIGFLFGALLAGVLLGALGKAAGLGVARLRFVRACDRVLAHLGARP
jgi:hypothetical protein